MSTQVIRTIPIVSQELIDTFIKQADASIGWKISEDSSQKCTRSFHLFFDAVTNFLAKVKSTDLSAGLSIEDERGVFQFAAKVEYFKNESGDDLPGNWGYSFTFNPDDLKKVDKMYSTSSNEFKDLGVLIAKNRYGMVLTVESNNSDYVSNEREVFSKVMGCVARTVRNWVDENSVSSEPVSVEIPGKVIIEAMLENDQKVCSITPSGELKNIIKDDCAIEYAVEKEKNSSKE